MSVPSGAGHREQIAVPVNSVPVSTPAATSPAAGRNTPGNPGEPLSVPQEAQRSCDPVQAPARRPQKRPDQNSQQRGARTAAAAKPATQTSATPTGPKTTAAATPSTAGATGAAASAPSSAGASFGQTLAASLSGSEATTRKAGQTAPPSAKSKVTSTDPVDPQALAAAAALLRQLPADTSAPAAPTAASTAAAPSAASQAGAPPAEANALAATALVRQTSALSTANTETAPSATQSARAAVAATTAAKTVATVPTSGAAGTTPPATIAPLTAQTNTAHAAAAGLTYNLSAQTTEADAAPALNPAPSDGSPSSAPDLITLADQVNTPQLLDVLTANVSGTKSDPLAVPDPSADAAPGATDPGSTPSASAPSGAAPQSANAAHAPSGAVEGPPMRSAVGSSAWTDELGARLTLMAHQGLASASLRLTPEHLGPVEVKISMRDSSASVWFGASQADTRAALEQALPRLRELFAAQGLNLTNAGVSGESPRGAPHSPGTPLAAPGGAAREAAVISVTSAAPARQGLIDTYA
jgi:flagellar hook-length control protein FliK